MLKSQNTAKSIIALLLLATLFGCGSNPSAPTTSAKSVPTALGSVNQSPAAYMAAAATAQDQQSRQRLLLLAAHAYLDENQAAAAENILTALQKEPLTEPEVQAENLYLNARVLEQKGNVADALNKLQYPASWQLPQQQWSNYHQMRARLFEKTKQPMEQIRELSEWSQYLPNKEARQLHQDIWALLKPAQEQTLEYYINKGGDKLYVGWLQLAYLAKHYAVDPASLVSRLSAWQRINPSHPAALQLPQDLQQALTAKPYHPQRIAVLLPLTGARASLAEPVRQGIVAAYLEEPDAATSINFFDTADGVEPAYQQALQSGAEFIIGPLLPNEVDQLVAQQIAQLKAPTTAAQAALQPAPPQLFLNHTTKMQPLGDRYYFALSPTQEASDAAQRMFQDGITRPLLLASNDTVSRRMAESFNSSWQALAHEDAEVHFYDPEKMRDTVQDALGVSSSQSRIKEIKSLLGNQVNADFRSRADINAIYMICSAHDLPLLKPFIDVNFAVFAEPVPLYTSSRARQDDSARQTVQELNNITISDIPWLLQNTSDSNLETLWPTWGNSQKRLYAMGYDSWQLVNKLAQMRAFPGYQFSGRSGLLSVNQDGVLNRQLTWGKYSRGVLRAQ